MEYSGEEVGFWSGVLALVSVIMPWFNITVVGVKLQISGYQTNAGLLIGILSAIVVFGFVSKDDSILDVVSIFGLLVTLIAIVQFVSPMFPGGVENTEIEKYALVPGIGLYLTLVAGIGMALAYHIELGKMATGLRNETDQQPDVYSCPECGEQVNRAHNCCGHCGTLLDE